VISIADPDDAGQAASRLLQLQAGERQWNLADFAVFSPREFRSNPAVGDLVAIPDVQRRLDSLVKAVLAALPGD
jgi:hypothetical protein